MAFNLKTCSKCLSCKVMGARANDWTDKKFCDKCGGELITECPNCKNSLRSDFFSGIFEAKFCGFCGKPFPWVK